MKDSLSFYAAITSRPLQLSDDKIDALMELFERVVSLEEKVVGLGMILGRTEDREGLLYKSDVDDRG